jgi:VCBS repeat-containing protein
MTSLPLAGADPLPKGYFTQDGGIAVDDNNGNPILYFTLENPGHSSDLGGVYSYALSGNPSGNFNALYEQSGSTGPDGALTSLTLDTAEGKYYVTDVGGSNDPKQGVWVGHLLGGAPTEFQSIEDTKGLGVGQVTNDAVPTLTGVSGTTTEAVQGGAALTLLGVTPTVGDPDSSGLTASATIQITNGKTGDQLFVGGSQSGTFDSGKVTVSWNSAGHTLVLSGADTFAEYQTLLALVTYQDAGTDTTTSGHPTRSISWSVSDGLLSSTTSTTTVTIDRPPATTTHNVNLLEGASTGTVSAGDTDPDGDSVTVTTAGTFVGTYGSLTLNANDTYSYTASNTSAINSAATGSHPTDTFGYTVSDGNGGTATETLSFAIDRPPTLAVQAGSTYTSTAPDIAVLSSATLSDPDGSDSMASATAQITTGFLAGDHLSYAGTALSTTPTVETVGGHQYDVSYNNAQAGGGELTITTVTGGSQGDYKTLLQNIDFGSSATDPTNSGTDTSRQISFQVTDQGGAASNIAIDTLSIVPCYCAGTLILTGRGEVPVEALTTADTVMTGAGSLRPIRWIGRRSYGGRFVMGRTDILPVCIKAGALDVNVPRRNLWISPHHAMYLEGVLIEARDLVNGVSIVQAERVEKVEYFHIELDTHDVIIAEGSRSESFIDDESRGMFHNAREYWALHPDAAAGPARYCAPRLRDGYEVEAVRRAIALRAGLHAPERQPGIGTLRGYVDVVSPHCIAGWAQNTDHPEAPVCLDIYLGDRLLGQTLANQHREDLERAGLGSGRHSFAFTPPAGLAIAIDAVRVRRSLDGAAVALSAALQQAQRGIDAQQVAQPALDRHHVSRAVATRPPRRAAAETAVLTFGRVSSPKVAQQAESATLEVIFAGEPCSPGPHAGASQAPEGVSLSFGEGSGGKAASPKGANPSRMGARFGDQPRGVGEPVSVSRTDAPKRRKRLSA